MLDVTWLLCMLVPMLGSILAGPPWQLLDGLNSLTFRPIPEALNKVNETGTGRNHRENEVSGFCGLSAWDRIQLSRPNPPFLKTSKGPSRSSGRRNSRRFALGSRRLTPRDLTRRSSAMPPPASSTGWPRALLPTIGPGAPAICKPPRPSGLLGGLRDAQCFAPRARGQERHSA